MDPDFIEKTFSPFLLRLVLLNYKIKNNVKIEDADLKTIKYLKHIIPIFNRFIKNENVSLYEELNKTQAQNHVKFEIEEYGFVDDKKDNKETIKEKKEVTEVKEIKEVKEVKKEEVKIEPDIEGDKQVKEYTEAALSKLDDIISNKWYTIAELTYESEVSEEEEDENNKEDTSESDEHPEIDLRSAIKNIKNIKESPKDDFADFEIVTLEDAKEDTNSTKLIEYTGYENLTDRDKPIDWWQRTTEGEKYKKEYENNFYNSYCC